MTDDELLQRFEAQALSRQEWTHRCHVKVAYLYLSRHPFAEALARIRQGIQALNKANKVPEGPASGYNETTTVAFAHLIAATIEAYGATLPAASAEEFCDRQPQLLSPHILRFFYSPERRMDPRAKTQFLEPDLAPLPRLGHRA
jgi:hypothetical protein